MTHHSSLVAFTRPTWQPLAAADAALALDRARTTILDAMASRDSATTRDLVHAAADGVLDALAALHNLSGDDAAEFVDAVSGALAQRISERQLEVRATR